MTKHCGLSKFLITFVAAMFCLTLAAPQSRADSFPPDGKGTQDLRVGDNSCVLVNCLGVLPDGSINLIQGVWDEIEPLNITFFPNSGVTWSARSCWSLRFLLRIYCSPSATLSDSERRTRYWARRKQAAMESWVPRFSRTIPRRGRGGPSSVVPFSLPDPLLDGTIFSAYGETWPDGDYPQGSVFDGLPAPPSQQKIFQTHLGLEGANAAVEIPDIILCQNIPDPVESAACTAGLIRPTGFTVWVYLIDTNQFGPQDNIHVDWRNIPIGTFAFAWGHNCSADALDNGQENCVSSQALTESAFLMPLPGNGSEIPEPTSLLLLGTGLLAIGRQWRKRAQSRKQDIT